VGIGQTDEKGLSLAMLPLLGLGDTWQPHARILVPQLVRSPQQITKRRCDVVGTLLAGSRCNS
jgi:hypothetical protein